MRPGDMTAPAVLPRIHGLVPVLETPFRADGSIDEESFRTVVAHVRDSGVSGAMFPGFASEYAKLDDAERAALTVAFVEEARRGEGFLAVVSVPDHGTEVAVRRAAEAVAAGAGAINVLPPHFLAPSREAIVEHVGEILSAVPSTPVVVQLAPGLTGASLAASDVAMLADRFPNLAAIKVESTPPGRVVASLRAVAPRLDLLVGLAGLHLPDALDRGATGLQPGCSVIELYVDLWELWQAGRREEFDDLHRRLVPYLSVWMTGVEFVVQVEKTISRERGLIATDVCRRPGYRLDATERRLIDRFLAEFSDRWARA